MTFHRPELAEHLSNKLLNPGAFDKIYRSGLFLSGPRRVGKTTFLREDLIPRLEAMGALAIYVDLWVDKTADPMELTVAAIRGKLQELANPLSRTWQMLKKVQKLNVKVTEVEFGFKLHDLAEPQGPTIAQAMVELVQQTSLSVVLLVDEVQHALTSETGQNLLHALKAARDAVNLNPERKGYFLFVGTGSHRARIGELTVSANQAFHGAKRDDFPVLDESFVKYTLDLAVDEQYARIPSLQAAWDAFEHLGHKPESLNTALSELQTPVPTVPVDVHLSIIAQVLRSRDADSQVEKILDMGELAAALFDRVCQQLGGYFGDPFRVELGQTLGVYVSAQQVQTAFKQLTSANVVMRIGHGVYDVTDDFVKKAWLERKSGPGHRLGGKP